MKQAQFEIIEETPLRIMIDDLGPHDQFPTITNDVEGVVERLRNQLKGRRLFYVDSEGEIDEIIVDKVSQKFVRFAPGFHSGY